MVKARILLVDDDPDILTILRDNLELDGYVVFTASSGRAGLLEFDNVQPDLMILDLSLPDVDGLQVCRLVRAKSAAPIIMLTARDSVTDKVLGLESGADDYLVKPFDYLELAARIRACLRRSDRVASRSAVLELGELVIDTNTNAVWRNGQRIDLTQREFNLLVFLASNSGRALNRKEIRRAVWPEGGIYEDSRAIDVHIQHLRSKLGDESARPQFIMTLPGVGYMFAHPKA